MSHLYILSDAETEAVNGGSFKFVINNAKVNQGNGMLAAPAAGGGVSLPPLFGFAGGGLAGVLAPQTNSSFIIQTALALG
jgi:hypothetical protein